MAVGTGVGVGRGVAVGTGVGVGSGVGAGVGRGVGTGVGVGIGVGAGVGVGFGFGVGLGFSVGVTTGGGVVRTWSRAGAGSLGDTGDVREAETGIVTNRSQASAAGSRTGRASRERARAFKEQRSLGAGRAHPGTRLTGRASRPREASSMVRVSCRPMTCGAPPFRVGLAVLPGTAP